MQDLKLFSKFTKQMLDAEEMKAVEINAEHLGLAKIQMIESKGKALAVRQWRIGWDGICSCEAFGQQT